MNDITLSLLGDRAAQDRVTERGELLPCQCGGEAKIKWWWKNREKPVYVKCMQCGMHRGPHMTAKEVALDWNTRAPILSGSELKKLEEEV